MVNLSPTITKWLHLHGHRTMRAIDWIPFRIVFIRMITCRIRECARIRSVGLRMAKGEWMYFETVWWSFGWRLYFVQIIIALGRPISIRAVSLGVYSHVVRTTFVHILAVHRNRSEIVYIFDIVKMSTNLFQTVKIHALMSALEPLMSWARTNRCAIREKRSFVFRFVPNRSPTRYFDISSHFHSSDDRSSKIEAKNEKMLKNGRWVADEFERIKI